MQVPGTGGARPGDRGSSKASMAPPVPGAMGRGGHEGHWGPLRGALGAFMAGLRVRAPQQGQGGLEAFWRARPGLLAAGVDVQHQSTQRFIEKQLIRPRTANRRGGGWDGPTSRKGDYVSWPERPNLRSGRGRALHQDAVPTSRVGPGPPRSPQAVDRARALLWSPAGGLGRRGRRPNHGREAYRPNPRSR